MIGHKRCVGISFAVALVGIAFAVPAISAEHDEITLIHIGDLHGHLMPRKNVRSDSSGHMEGGLARVFKKIELIRHKNEKGRTLLFNTGDTVQGSAEVLYTRGQAIVDVVNEFGIDAFAPGNWDYVYGTQRFLELFVNHPAKAPWNAIAANAYYSTLAEDPSTPFPAKAGQLVMPPYLIKQVGELKIGVLGFTNNRGPQVVGTTVTKGFKFTGGDSEVKHFVPVLRDVEHVDLIVMISELGLANNIRLAELQPGIDVILSSDMHERTRKAVVVTSPQTGGKTIIVEEGEDGTMIGEITLKLEDRHVAQWRWRAHIITDEIEEDRAIARKVEEVRKTFVSGPDFTHQVNPLNGSLLKRPIDTVVGYTTKPLYRSNFSDEDMPAVIEGSSHDFLTDAFRAMTGADVGAIRGFRYGTQLAAGPITLADLYHFVAIGPQIAKGTIIGQQLKNQIENAADGSLNPDVSKWTGGWLFNFSGVTMDIDPYQPLNFRASSIRVNGVPLDVRKNYTYASYWYARDSHLINVLPATNITVLKDTDGSPLDGTEVVVRYLASLPGRTVDTQLNRIRLLQPLPIAPAGFKVIQPLRGATLNPAPIFTSSGSSDRDRDINHDDHDRNHDRD
ncbi:MAG TPA: 5'-nucleotidase C-terminal domain-containing protein [Acidiferrobacterales bacterium]|nr:5'-nucleotidase C-terminal domain-containing protein [Acidiferrobacterales bacterium]